MACPTAARGNAISRALLAAPTATSVAQKAAHDAQTSAVMVSLVIRLQGEGNDINNS